MTRDDVLTVFAPKISDGVMQIGDGQYVDVDTFVSLFSDAPSSPTYTDLVAIDRSQDYGYTPFFDECKAEGLLN